MTPPLSSRRRSKTPPPGETGQEGLYLRSLSDRQVVVNIKLRDGETVRGWIEYFDDSMLRLTRENQPNLFIYKTPDPQHQRSWASGEWRAMRLL